MSDAALIDSPARAQMMAEAAEFGFTSRDITDPHVAIALITGRAYARHVVEDEIEASDGMAKIVVAATAYGGDFPSEDLAFGIEGLVELGDLGGFQAIEKISRLLGYFARSTCTHPREIEMTAWRNLITDISIELRIALGRHAGTDADPDIEALKRNMRRVVEHLHRLWS